MQSTAVVTTDTTVVFTKGTIENVGIIYIYVHGFLDNILILYGMPK